MRRQQQIQAGWDNLARTARETAAAMPRTCYTQAGYFGAPAMTTCY